MTRRRQNTENQLVIDRSAAAEVATAAALAEWARDKRVFVSSVMAELRDERNAAAAAVREIGGRPILFEEFGARDADPENAYLGEVETSEIYVGILGKRYGRLLPSHYSATHTEYLHAVRVGLRIAVWATAVADREGHEQSFLDEVRTFHVVPECGSPAQLAQQLRERLATIAAEDLAPWCKLGNVVFRATEVLDRGEEIAVVAKVRNDDIAHALERFRSGHGHYDGDLRFAWGGRCKHVRVAAVHARSTAARSRTFTITLEVVEGRRDSLIEMSFNGLTPDDQTRIGLEASLFGTKPKITDRHMEFLVEIPDPLEPLREASVPDEIVRPLAELLVVDLLVGTGRASRVSEFSLGAPVRSLRQLVLAWEPPKRVGEPGGAQRVSGQVSL